MFVFGKKSSLTESVLDIGKTLRSSTWKSQPDDLYQLFDACMSMTGSAAAVECMFAVTLDGQDYFIGEGSLDGGVFAFDLLPGSIPQPFGWLLENVRRELSAGGIDDMRGRQYRFRIDGRPMAVSSIKLVQIDIPEHGPVKTFRLDVDEDNTAGRASVKRSGHVSTARQVTDFIRGSGKVLSGCPQAWIVYGDDGTATPTVPNFAIRNGKFVKVHLITLDDMAKDERIDAENTVRLLRNVPQDAELIFEFGHGAYEIDDMKFPPAEGLRVELRTWGEIDESAKPPYVKTIRDWNKMVCESATDGVWMTADNSDIMSLASRFSRMF